MKSNVDGLEYIPDKTEEEIHGDTFIEWYLSKEHPVFIRLKPDDVHGQLPRGQAPRLVSGLPL
jgi:hypothetical protein